LYHIVVFPSRGVTFSQEICCEQTSDYKMHKGIRKPFNDDVRHVHAELSWQGRSAHVSVIRSSGIQKPIARREGGSGLFLFWEAVTPNTKLRIQGGNKR